MNDVTVNMAKPAELSVEITQYTHPLLYQHNPVYGNCLHHKSP